MWPSILTSRPCWQNSQLAWLTIGAVRAAWGPPELPPPAVTALRHVPG
ncbi:hypothetical protein [Longispora fulva]